MEFAERYGPWAVITGGSDGTGLAFAKKIARHGVSLILVARRDGLEEAAQAIRTETGVEVVTAAIDLGAVDAGEQIVAVVGAREVGLFVNNAGADWIGKRFLDGDLDEWLRLNRINVDTMLTCVHAFGAGMMKRRRGGILTVNSGAGYAGSKYLAVYCGAKAFQLTFAESLWSELRGYDVDVLTLVLSRTDTPAFRALSESLGLTIDEGKLAHPDAVADAGLARLRFGPVHNFGVDDEIDGFGGSSAGTRRQKTIRFEAIAAANGYGSPDDP